MNLKKYYLILGIAGLVLTITMLMETTVPKSVGAATTVPLGKNGTSQYLLYPTDSLTADRYIATSTTASSTFQNVEMGQAKLGTLNGLLTAATGFVSTIATSSLGLPTFTTLNDYLSLATWYATTTDGLDEGTTNKYDKTVAFTNGTNVSMTGTYPNFTIVDSLTPTYTNSTTTSATTTNFAISSIASKILLTNAGGSVIGYGGTSCTNQFVRSLSALGAATCATVGAADVSLANLTATNGTLTFSGTYNGATARTIGLNLGNSNAWTALQTFNTAGIIATASSTITRLSSTYSTSTNATSTNLFATAFVATGSTITNGTTTNATSTNLYVSTGLTGTRNSLTGLISPVKRLSYISATSTAWTATTSGAYLPPIISPFAGTIHTAQCSTDAGTLNVDIYHTTTHLTLFNASTTVGTVSFSSNNTVTNGEKIYIAAGTPASSPTVLSCTLSITETP